MRQAMIKATVIGLQNTSTRLLEYSTDLPPDPIGEVVVEALQDVWKAGDDPVNCIVIIQFTTVEVDDTPKEHF